MIHICHGNCRWSSVLVLVCPEFREGTSVYYQKVPVGALEVRISVKGFHLLFLVINSISDYRLSFMCVCVRAYTYIHVRLSLYMKHYIHFLPSRLCKEGISIFALEET